MALKRRLIKKWINRYITPHIKGLPTTQEGAVEIKIGEAAGYAIMQAIGRSQQIINGKPCGEGQRGFPCDNLRLNLGRTGNELKRIIATHEHVYLRFGPELRGNRTYIRLITE